MTITKNEVFIGLQYENCYLVTRINLWWWGGGGGIKLGVGGGGRVY